MGMKIKFQIPEHYELQVSCRFRLTDSLGLTVCSLIGMCDPYKCPKREFLQAVVQMFQEATIEEE